MVKQASFLLFALMGLLGSNALALNDFTYYHFDHLGSPIAATDEGGVVLWNSEYSTFGEEFGSKGSTDRHGYANHEYLADFKISYMGARWYEPRSGRFLSTDAVRPYSNTISINRYAYANNNPYQFVDPDGNVPFDYFWDGISIVYDVGKIGFGYATGNAKLVTDGSIDLAADTIAFAIPYLPAGSTKVARWSAGGADAVSTALAKAGTLRKAIGLTDPAKQAHHIIPKAVLKNNKAAQAAVMAGFDFNGKINGRGLLTTLHGSHSNYSKFVVKKLNEWAALNPGFTPKMAKDYIESKLLPQLNGIVDWAEKTGTRLHNVPFD